MLSAALTGCPEPEDDNKQPGPVDPDKSTVTVRRATGVVANGVDATEIEVMAVDAAGTALAGLTVNLDISGGGNTVTQPGETNEYGVAIGKVVSTVAGTKTVAATVGPNAVALAQKPTIEFVEYVKPAVEVAFQAEPADGVSGEKLAAVKVAFLDADGEVVVSETSKVTLELATNPVSAALAGTLTRSAVDGVATFDDLVINKPGEGFKLEASAGTFKVTSKAFDVAPGAAKLLAISGLPAEATAGAKVGFTVTARDALGNVATGYRGKVKFTSTDAKASAIADYSFTEEDAGVHEFAEAVAFGLEGVQTLTATDASNSAITGTRDIEIKAGAAAALVIENVTGGGVAGVAMGLEVKAVDAFGNPAADYQGEVAFQATGKDTVVPEAYKFQAADQGKHAFTGIVFVEAGAHTLTVKDTATETIAAKLENLAVGPAAAGKLIIDSLVGTRVAGAMLSASITARDEFGNVATGYRGKVTFETTDDKAALPADYTFSETDAGKHSFNDEFQFKTAGSHSLTVKDASNSSISGKLEPVVIASGTKALLAIKQGPSEVEVRSAMTPAVTVEIRDGFGNVAADATDAVALALLPEGGASGKLTGGSAAAAEGVASFAALKIDEEGSYKLEASSGELTKATSEIFAVTDKTPPAKPSLAVETTDNGSATLTWKSVGDDGQDGTAKAWELRYSPEVIDSSSSFDSATLAASGTPKAAGEAETVAVTGLNAETAYHFGLKVTDGAGNSVLAVATGTTTSCPANFAPPSCTECLTGFKKDAKGACVNYCAEANPCTNKPADFCTLKKATVHKATGVCSPGTEEPFFSCDYQPAVTDCGAEGKVCVAGVCVEGSAPGEGDLLITEVMHLPTVDDERHRWFEVKNLSGKQLDLAGLKITSLWNDGSDDVTKSFSLPADPPVLLPADGYFVFGGSKTASENGGNDKVGFAWDSEFILPHAGKLKIELGTTVIEELAWDSTKFPHDAGASMGLSAKMETQGGNLVPWYWCSATSTVGANKGTPGAVNDACASVIDPTRADGVDWCNLKWPTDASAVTGAKVDVYSRFYEPGVTTLNQQGNDQYPYVEAQVGFGAAEDSSGWSWTNVTYEPTYGPTSDQFSGNNDEMHGALVVKTAGAYKFGLRYRLFDASKNEFGAYVYCDKNGKAAGATSTNWGTLNVTTGTSATTGQINTVRAAADGALTQVVDGALVTYLKPATGTEKAGFFLQAEKVGPALFVEIDPATTTPALVVGDRVKLTVTEKAAAGSLPFAKAISDLVRLSQGSDVKALVQDVTAATDLVSAVGTYDSELVGLTGTVVAAATGSGTGYTALQFDTTGVTGNTNLKLRIPTPVQEALDLGVGCKFELAGVPVWRYFSQAQISAFDKSEIKVVSCPAPTVVSAITPDDSHVLVTFSRMLKVSTVKSDGSQFVVTGGTLAVSAAELNGNTVKLTTAKQEGGTVYTLTVDASITDYYGTALGTPNTAQFFGFLPMAKLMLTEVGPNISGGADMVELKVLEAGTLLGLSLVQDPSGGGTVLATLPAISVQKDDLVVVHLKAPAGITDEATAKDQCSDSACYAGAWDVKGGTSDITYSARIIAVRTSGGDLQDAVPFANNNTPPASFVTQLAAIQSLGLWLPADCGGVACDATTGKAIAAVWTAVGSTATGATVALKKDAEGNKKEDWAVGAHSWGLPNP